jgi:hypothetical protein
MGPPTTHTHTHTHTHTQASEHAQELAAEAEALRVKVGRLEQIRTQQDQRCTDMQKQVDTAVAEAGAAKANIGILQVRALGACFC